MANPTLNLKSKPPWIFYNEKYYIFLFEYAIMFMKVQSYVKFPKVSKIRPQIAPD
jgi:hypothetical protein